MSMAIVYRSDCETDWWYYLLCLTYTYSANGTPPVAHITGCPSISVPRALGYSFVLKMVSEFTLCSCMVYKAWTIHKNEGVSPMLKMLVNDRSAPAQVCSNNYGALTFGQCALFFQVCNRSDSSILNNNIPQQYFYYPASQLLVLAPRPHLSDWHCRSVRRVWKFLRASDDNDIVFFFFQGGYAQSLASWAVVFFSACLNTL